MTALKSIIMKLPLNIWGYSMLDTGMYCTVCDTMLHGENMMHSESEQCMNCNLGYTRHCRLCKCLLTVDEEATCKYCVINMARN